MTDPSGWLTVESLDLEARGVAHNTEGKVVFIEGALPGEQVRANASRRKNNWEQATLVALRRESPQRVEPGCPHFGLHSGACGGCKMQHLHVTAQVAVKQRVLEDALWHLGKVKPQQVLRPVEGPPWGYRYRARLSVRYVAKKNTVLVGFHERKSRYVADMPSCAVLPPHVSALLMPLRELVGEMDQRDRVPQIELAVGDAVIALVLRHLEPLTQSDIARLRAFAAQYGVQWWLQAKGPDTAMVLDEPGPPLSYTLPEFGVTLGFKPTDFTQVNPHINGALVKQAFHLLDVQPSESVIDWFCGLGNFTLPLATRAESVLGIEDNAMLVQRAGENARRNGLEHKMSFQSRDLTEMPVNVLTALGTVDKWLIDPPREGAFALAKALAELAATPMPKWRPPRRVVYVSCNPATLARDAGVLVNHAGYRFAAAGVVNMFPHTAHVESIAAFELR